jgi:hypothetical protein
MTNLIGSRVLTLYSNRVFSPVYGYHEWYANRWQKASCAVGCSQVPSDTHQGCGFHAHISVAKTRLFANHIKQMAGAIVLIEGKGRFVLGTGGFRVEEGRIIAVVNRGPEWWGLGGYESLFGQSRTPQIDIASLLNIPLIDEVVAQGMIDEALERVNEEVQGEPV